MNTTTSVSVNVKYPLTYVLFVQGEPNVCVHLLKVECSLQRMLHWIKIVGSDGHLHCLQCWMYGLPHFRHCTAPFLHRCTGTIGSYCIWIT